ncbi:hypothetical protein M413DRAFT_245692 [Hebeloma cylindrosporum]|uniref:DUF6534 domain-containing protein n=1 Tax=Hebeloma cylindrosporum TaxID=76867 RepID=A0A0C2XKW8_HEBCY|nr:hypothetical protein M413DRAFT_245692 [Hebeloma cylindrosporum h7]
MELTLDNTIGIMFLGISVACIIFGTSLVQTQLYYSKFPKDWMLQRVSVGILIILAALHLALTLHAIYYYVIVNFGRLAGLGSIIWSFKLQATISAVMIVYVQGLYAQRIWKLGRHFSRFFPALAGVIVAGGWALGFIVVVQSYTAKSFEDLNGIRPIICASFILVTAVDVMITCAMCFALNESRSSFVGTNNKVIMIMRYVLVTGSLTSACSLASLITYIIMPNNLVFMGVGFILPNLYVNSYISLLNARKSMNSNEREPSSVEVSGGMNIRSGFAQRMDAENIHSGDNKDGIHLSAAKFNSSFSSNKYDPEEGVPSKHIEIVVQRTEERQYDQDSRSE